MKDFLEDVKRFLRFWFREPIPYVVAAMSLVLVATRCAPAEAVDAKAVVIRQVPAPSPDLICVAFYQDSLVDQAFAGNCVKR